MSSPRSSGFGCPGAPASTCRSATARTSDLVALTSTTARRRPGEDVRASSATVAGASRSAREAATRAGTGSSSTSRATRCDYLFVLVGDGRRWLIPAGASRARPAHRARRPEVRAYEVEPGGRSSCRGGLIAILWRRPGGVPERSKGCGCKPHGTAFAGSNPAPAMKHQRPRRAPASVVLGWRGCASRSESRSSPSTPRLRRDARAWREAEEMGVDTIFTWDHFFPLYGDPDGAHFECMTTAGVAGRGHRARRDRRARGLQLLPQPGAAGRRAPDDRPHLRRARDPRHRRRLVREGLRRVRLRVRDRAEPAAGPRQALPRIKDAARQAQPAAAAAGCRS